MGLLRPHRNRRTVYWSPTRRNGQTVDENEMKCVNLESFSFRKADNLADGGAAKESGGSSTSMPQLPHRPPVQDALNSVTAGGNPLKFTHFLHRSLIFRRVGTGERCGDPRRGRGRPARLLLWPARRTRASKKVKCLR